MPVDEELRGQLLEHLEGTPEVEPKPMFGGVAFTLHGNLLCGVMEDALLVRIARKDFDRFIDDAGARPMVMAGKSGKSFILIDKSVVSSPTEMKK
jgi:TfoX/Sxy family transcriptional regulator of competence genes